ncbi:MAG: AAA family ATPase [Eubacteriales bacterium]|nr:AAA family ATPase [Eubacteriales bacterium]
MLVGFDTQHFAILDQFQLGLSFADIEASGEGPGPRESAKDHRLNSLSCLLGRSSTGKSSVFLALHFLSQSLLYGPELAAERIADAGFDSLLNYADQDGKSIGLGLNFYRPSFKEYLRYELEFISEDYETKVQYERVLKHSRQGTEVLLEVQNGEGWLRPERPNAEGPSTLDEQEPIELLDDSLQALAIYGRMLQYPSLAWLYRQIANCFVTQDPFDLNRLPARVRPGVETRLAADFSNARNVLAYYQQRDDRRVEKLQTVERILDKIPDTKITGDGNLDRQLTSGNLKLFLYYLLLEGDYSLICLDSPEAGLYHEQVEDLIREMRIYLDHNWDCQIILSSHSNILLDNLRPEEVWVMEREGLAAEEAKVQATWLGDKAKVQAMYKEGVSLGSMWYSGHLSQASETWYKERD